MPAMVDSAWPKVLAGYRAVAEEVAGLVASVDDPAAPGLGEWTVVELAAHTMRALTTVEEYVTAGATGPAQLEDAAAYVAAYLDARRRHPELDAQVAARGRQSVSALGDDPGREFSATVARVAALLATTDGETTVSTPWGTIRLVDYLRTRVMELVMHGMDLAAALSVDWRPPPEALTDTLHLLSDVAVRTGLGPDLARMLGGRAAAADVLPIIR
jgi:hypothetical protein